MPTLEQMQTFVAIVEGGSLKEAAHRLFVAPSTVTVRLQGLESELGRQLLTRRGPRIGLSDAGERVYQIAVEMLSLEERLTSFARSDAHPHLTLGAGNTIGTYLVPRLISRYRERQPRIDIRVDIANTPRTLAKLSRGTVDVALVSGHAGRGPFAQLQVLSYRPMVIFPPGHPIGASDSISMADVVRHPVILRERGSMARREVDAWFRGCANEPTIALELNNMEAIKVSVACGLGLAFASPFSVQDEVRFGLLGALPLAGFDTRRGVYLAWSRDHDKEKEILDLVRFFSSPEAAKVISDLGALCTASLGA